MRVEVRAPSGPHRQTLGGRAGKHATQKLARSAAREGRQGALNVGVLKAMHGAAPLLQRALCAAGAQGARAATTCASPQQRRAAAAAAHP